MVLLEALAAGVPPLGSRVDGITDVIEHGNNGLLFEPGSAAAIAETDRRSHQRPARLASIAAKCDCQPCRAIFRSRNGRRRCRIYRRVLESHDHD